MMASPIDVSRPGPDASNTSMNEREIRHRRDQLARASEAHYGRNRLQQELEAALWESLNPAEQRAWRAFSDAVGRVPPA